MAYWTKSPGTGGKITREEDFVVEEVPLKKFLVKFERSGSGVRPISGPYMLFLLKKKGLTTKDALRYIAKKFSIEKKDIGYAGLKDKFAVTTQYITLKGKISDFQEKNIELTKIAPCQSFMSVGELESNKFRITLRGTKKPDNVEKTAKELENGLPNYFGGQRFGVSGDNDKVGLAILKRDFETALKLINQNGKDYPSLAKIDRKTLKFFIHAYQSNVFNRVLDEYIRKNKKPSLDKFPIPGSDTKLKNDFGGKETARILKSDGISLDSFRIKELGMTCTGSARSAFVAVKNLKYKVNSNTVVLEFELPKGSYATVLIREVVKDGRS